MGSGGFLSRSKKQTATTDSSTVAEFIATHLASKEVMWARALLSEMGHEQTSPTVIGEDNMSTNVMIQNDCNGQKTKHVAIIFNMFRELVQQLVIAMEHLSTADMNIRHTEQAARSEAANTFATEVAGYDGTSELMGV